MAPSRIDTTLLVRKKSSELELGKEKEEVEGVEKRKAEYWGTGASGCTPTSSGAPVYALIHVHFSYTTTCNTMHVLLGVSEHVGGLRSSVCMCTWA